MDDALQRPRSEEASAPDRGHPGIDAAVVLAFGDVAGFEDRHSEQESDEAQAERRCHGLGFGKAGQQASDIVICFHRTTPLISTKRLFSRGYVPVLFTTQNLKIQL